MGRIIEVSSSNVKQIRHNEDENTLDVWFNNSGDSFYRYQGVDFVKFSEFVVADSKGKFFAEHIKHLEFKKLTEE